VLRASPRVRGYAVHWGSLKFKILENALSVSVRIRDENQKNRSGTLNNSKSKRGMGPILGSEGPMGGTHILLKFGGCGPFP